MRMRPADIPTFVLVVVLCLVATGLMLLVPPRVLDAGLIYQGF